MNQIWHFGHLDAAEDVALCLRNVVLSAKRKLGQRTVNNVFSLRLWRSYCILLEWLLHLCFYISISSCIQIRRRRKKNLTENMANLQKPFLTASYLFHIKFGNMIQSIKEIHQNLSLLRLRIDRWPQKRRWGGLCEGWTKETPLQFHELTAAL